MAGALKLYQPRLYAEDPSIMYSFATKFQFSRVINILRCLVSDVRVMSAVVPHPLL